MKSNKTLIIITVVAIIINVLFQYHSTTLKGGVALYYDIIFPIFWFVSLLLLSSLIYRKRKLLLSRKYIFKTVICLFLCSPIPVLAYREIIKTSIKRQSTDIIHHKNGSIMKKEKWIYNNGKNAILKYWISNDGETFRKDSTWIYFNQKGDTINTQ